MGFMDLDFWLLTIMVFSYGEINSFHPNDSIFFITIHSIIL